MVLGASEKFNLPKLLKDLNTIEVDNKYLSVPENIMKALCDDLNTPKALAELNIISNNIAYIITTKSIYENVSFYSKIPKTIDTNNL